MSIATIRANFKLIENAIQTAQCDLTRIAVYTGKGWEDRTDLPGNNGPFCLLLRCCVQAPNSPRDVNLPLGSGAVPLSTLLYTGYEW